MKPTLGYRVLWSHQFKECHITFDTLPEALDFAAWLRTHETSEGLYRWNSRMEKFVMVASVYW